MFGPRNPSIDDFLKRELRILRRIFIHLKWPHHVRISPSFNNATNILMGENIIVPGDRKLSIPKYRELGEEGEKKRERREKRRSKNKRAAFLHLRSIGNLKEDNRREGGGAPDEPFPNLRISKSVDRRILYSSETSRDGF